MTQLALFGRRIRFDGDWAMVRLEVPGSTLAVVRFDGEWRVGSYDGCVLLVDLTEVDDER